jgi:hypothetical protein
MMNKGRGKAGHWAGKGTVAEKQEDLTPRQKLLRRILSLRNSIEAQKGLLSESYPLIREDRER